MRFVEQLKSFLRRPATMAFLAFTAVYAVALAFVFWGAWSLDKVPIAPDCQTTFGPDDVSTWFSGVLNGASFVPSDLMHVLGGMYFWVELQFALAAWLAALGVAYYLRGRRCSLLASYGGGAAFGLMGYCFTLFSAGHLGWFIWLMYGPFAFGLVDRCVRLGGWFRWALLGAVLAWSSARQPDLWLMFFLLLFAYGVWCLVRERKTLRWGRLLSGAGVCLVAVALVGMPQFGNAIFHELGNREKQIAETTGGAGAADAAKSDDPAVQAKAREERWRFCTSWSLPPEDLLEFAVSEVHGGSNDPRVFQKPGNRPYQGRLGQQVVVPPGPGGRHPVTGQILKAGDVFWMPYRQHSLYFGLLTLLFALAGVVGMVLRRGREDAAAEPDGGGADWSDVPFWIVAALVALLCALGCFTPFYKIVFALPFGDQIRCPVKFVHLVEFCVAVLAGFGVEFLRARFGRGRAWVAVALGGLLVVNVLDLARVDAKYLAVQDVSIQRAPNAAAGDVAKLGGGRVAVMVRARAYEINDALLLHGAETAKTGKEPDIRFVLAGRDELAANPGWRAQLKPVGGYRLSQDQGFCRDSQPNPQYVLLQVPNVPAPAPKAPEPARGVPALAWLSVLSTLGIALWGVAARFLPRRRGTDL